MPPGVLAGVWFVGRLPYDGEGNKTLETSWFDAATPRLDTTFLYDDAGRLVRREEPLGRLTLMEYDGVGNVVSETLLQEGDDTAAARRMTYAYDGLNRRIRTTRIFECAPTTRNSNAPDNAVRYDRRRSTR